jgi:molybdopterin-guanine dinucleotide biosynthesis adapter protein
MTAATPAVLPPIVSIIGRRNSGKTTLLVGIAAELRRHGLRVASIKHSHHEFEMDVPGKDSWRHFHDGGVEAVIIASPTQVAMRVRTEGADRDPVALARRFLAGETYDLVLVEAFTTAALPKIEIFRRAAHPHPIWGQTTEPAQHGVVGTPASQGGGRHIAMVTDAPELVNPPFPLFPLAADGGHVITLAVWLAAKLAAGELSQPA